MKPKPPHIFLVSIRIGCKRPSDARRFARMIAAAAEEEYRKNQHGRLGIVYDCNLSKWEEL